MPKYRNPQTGEVVEHVGDGLEEFYLSHGWVIVDGKAETQPPSDMGELLNDLDDEPKKKGK